MSETYALGLQPEPEGGEVSESVRGALASYVLLSPGQVFPEPPDAEAVRSLVSSCRKCTPDATEDEIVHSIHKKGAIAKRNRVSDPVSFLLTSVPEFFTSGEISRYRTELKEKAERAETAKRTAEEGWVCPKCNEDVNAPRISDKKKRVCSMGHNVEKPMSFFGALVGIPVFIILAALATHVVGWVWDLPARLLNTFTVEAGISILPLVGLFKGFRHLFVGGPSRRLAAGYFGMMLGGGLMFLLVSQSWLLATARPDGHPGVTFNPLCIWPEQPYYTDRSAERVYRFLSPYGIYNDFVGNCGK